MWDVRSAGGKLYMKLSELHPEWVDSYGGRRGVMISFDCPCGKREVDSEGDDLHRVMLSLVNPLDEKGPYERAYPMWRRVGTTFDTLSLTPSVFRDPAKGGCGWHGFVTQGEVISVLG